jgi:cell division protease FtsH
VFLGRSVTQHKQVSDVTAHQIDEEVRQVIDANYARAREILSGRLPTLHKMAEVLMRYETINEQQIKDIMAGLEPKPPQDWDEGAAAPANVPPAAGADPKAALGGVGTTPAGQH